MTPPPIPAEVEKAIGMFDLAVVRYALKDGDDLAELKAREQARLTLETAIARAIAGGRDDALNQCDGCRQGAGLRDGLHIDAHGRSFMACQADRYLAPPAPEKVDG